MFTVNDNPIIADEMDVIRTIRDECYTQGLDLFRVIRPSGNSDIMVNCPFHKGGMERKPSFGISRVDGTCHCFTCGWVGSIDEMISSIMGYDDAGAYGRKWLARHFITVSIEARKPLQISLQRGAAVRKKPTPGFTEQELEKYRFYHPYMYQRGLDDDTIELFDVGYDKAFSLKNEHGQVVSTFPCITFPTYHLDGTPAFIARRAIKTKLFHYPQDVEKPVYGADRIANGDYSEVIIAESVLNALTCWRYGRPAVALLGTGTEYQYDVLRSLNVRKYILGMDPDEAGKRATQKLYNNLKSTKVVTFFDIPANKDLNDLDDGVIDLPEYF